MRLMMGDCLERMNEIEDGSVDLVLTDPPYGTTACKWDAVIPFEPMWAQVWRVLKPNGAGVFTASQPFTSALVMSGAKWFSCSWIWAKTRGSNPALVRKQPFKKHEDVLVFSRSQPTYNPKMTKGKLAVKSGRGRSMRCDGVDGGGFNMLSTDEKKVNDVYYPSSVIDISSPAQGVNLHPTQKPVALMEYLIRTYTNEGETVLDFTMGSGTTGVACANTNRQFIGIERDPTYFQIAQQRIEESQRRLL